MDGKSDIRSILNSSKDTKERYANDPASWEAFVLNVFEENLAYAKASNLPKYQGGCLIIVPLARRYDHVTFEKLYDFPTPIYNLKKLEENELKFYFDYATIASTDQLASLRGKPAAAVLDMFTKIYLFRFTLVDLISFHSLNVWQDFDRFHLVDFKEKRKKLF